MEHEKVIYNLDFWKFYDRYDKFKALHIPCLRWEFLKENKKVRKRERKHALDQEGDQENDQEKNKGFFFFSWSLS